MYDKRLIAFIKAADCHSITKASEELYISPNSVSRQIQELEQEWNTDLFTRTSHGVFLTVQGKYFYDHALDIIQLSNNIHTNVPKSRKNKNVIRIAYTFINCKNNITSVCKNYQKEHPELSISFFPYADFSKANINSTSQLSYYDLFLGPSIYTNSNFTFKKLFTLSFGCLVSPSNPLASKKTITLNDLKKTKIYFLNQSISPDFDLLRTKFNDDYNILDISDLSNLNNEDGVLILPSGINFLLSPGYFKPLNTELGVQYGIYSSIEGNEKLQSIIMHLVQNVKCY